MSETPNTPNPFGGSSSGSNPFKAPSAAVADVASTTVDNFIEGGRSVAAGQGVAWITSAWKLFTANPLIWIVMAVIAFVIIVVLAFIPIIGSLATAMLFPFIFAGIAKGAKALEDGETLEIGHLFAGFSEKGGPLAILGLLYLAGTIVLTLIMVAMMFMIGGGALAGAATGMGGDSSAMAGAMGMGFVLAMLVVAALSIPLFMMIWFAPVLIMFHDYDAIKAAKESFFACLKNIVPFLLFGIVAFVAMIVGMIPIGLGLLVVGPVLYISNYTSYRDIFIEA